MTHSVHAVAVFGSPVEGGQTGQENREDVVGSEMGMGGIAGNYSDRCSASLGGAVHIEAAVVAHWDL